MSNVIITISHRVLMPQLRSARPIDELYPRVQNIVVATAPLSAIPQSHYRFGNMVLRFPALGLLSIIPSPRKKAHASAL